MIALLDYGSGNLRSVHKSLLKVGADVRIVQRPDEIGDARAMVLPGVGAFDDCINALRKQELLEAARDFIQTGKPFLGICVGYQALFERSEEFNSCAAGLGIFQGSVVRFTEKPGLKIPQIGWNQLDIVQTGLPALSRHRQRQLRLFRPQLFSAAGGCESIIATRTDYGGTFASSIWRDNVFATQFHPEKSQKVGLQLLKNFVELAKG